MEITKLINILFHVNSLYTYSYVVDKLIEFPNLTITGVSLKLIHGCRRM